MFATDEKQTGPLLAVYSYFRIVLAIILIGISFIDGKFHFSTEMKFTAFLVVACGYCLATVSQAILHHINRYTFSAPLIFFAILVDELFILALVYLGHAFSTEITFLQAIPIAVAGMFFSGSLATIFAALATVATLANMFYFSFDTNFRNENFIQAGLLGVVFFIVSFAMQFIARKIRATELKAYENELHAREMAIISRHIVQRIRTGLIIFSIDGDVILTNDAAEEHLGTSPITDFRNTLLYGCYKNWQQDPALHHQTIRAGKELNEIQVRFSNLNYKGHVIAFTEGMAEIAQQAQQIKLATLGRLSASIAHEIRNPLSAISHSLQLLNESPGLQSEEDRHLLEISKKHISRINNTVSSILEMSKSRQYNPKKINLYNLIEELRLDYAEKFPGELEFIIEQPDAPVMISFDETQLVQILSNIIDNAIIFSLKAKGKHWVKVGINAEQHNPYRNASINIHDLGLGVPENLREKIFDPFFTTETAGTGLGLYIAKELCTLNQSQLEYIEKEGEKYFQIRFSHPDRNILLYSG